MTDDVIIVTPEINETTITPELENIVSVSVLSETIASVAIVNSLNEITINAEQQVTNVAVTVEQIPTISLTPEITDTEVSLVIETGTQGPQGIQGIQGPEGPPGGHGSVWFQAPLAGGAPSNSVGVDGDFFLDNDTGNVWHKQAGVWQ